MACQIPVKSGLPSAVRGPLYFGAGAVASGRATGRAGAFCANAGDTMIPCTITTRMAMMAMYFLEARIPILHSNRSPAHRGCGFSGFFFVAFSLFPTAEDTFKNVFLFI